MGLLSVNQSGRLGYLPRFDIAAADLPPRPAAEIGGGRSGDSRPRKLGSAPTFVSYQGTTQGIGIA